MNPRRIRNTASSLCAVALACAATAVSAQMMVVYKQTDLAGHTVYTDRPEMAAAPSQEDATESDPQAPRAKPAPSRRFSAVNVTEAQRRLAQAQRKRNQGTAPLPGESVQGPGGMTVNYRYWQRQEKLRIEVEQAQRRANAVQRPVLAGK